MKNKIREFLIGFNGELENSNRYCNLQSFDNGFVKGIVFPEIHLFDDDNDDTAYVEEMTLSRLVKTLGEVLEVANKELIDKVDDYFAEENKKLKEKFPNVKIKFRSHSILDHYVIATGVYDEDKLLDALDVIKQDFEYIFESLKLDINF